MKKSICFMIALIFIIANLSLNVLVFGSTVKGVIYEIGPNREFEALKDINWESVKPGDEVHIFYKDEPYREKLYLFHQGTKEKPILIKGIPNNEGKLPVLDGSLAKTATPISFWNEDRAIIKIGGGQNEVDGEPKYIIIDSLDIRNAIYDETFINHKGNEQKYIQNAAGIFIEKGSDIIIRNCAIHDCMNGIQTSDQTSNIVIKSNYIYRNGRVGSGHQHNTYTESLGMLYESNYFGPLKEGANGQNLKDRSSGLIIRYNTFHDAYSREMDLVDAHSLHMLENEEYDKAYVYGNVIYNSNVNLGSQRNIIHFGGDNVKENYKEGPLYFYNNTVIADHKSGNSIFSISSSNGKVFAYNNIFVDKQKSGLALLFSHGNLYMKNNYISNGYIESEEGKANVNYQGNQIIGDENNFIDINNKDYRLVENSKCIDSGTEINKEGLFGLNWQIDSSNLTNLIERKEDNQIDIGAFSFDNYNNSIDFEQIIKGEIASSIYVKEEVIVKEIMTLSNKEFKESDKTIKIDFTMRDREIDEGYIKDTGDVFSLKDNGYEYGWNEPILEHQMRYRKSDEAINANNTHFENISNQNYTWEIALNNGNYLVSLTAGDSQYASSNDIRIEDQRAIYQGLKKGHVTVEKEVEVIDGKLTLTFYGRADKLSSIVITSVESLNKELGKKENVEEKSDDEPIIIESENENKEREKELNNDNKNDFPKEESERKIHYIYFVIIAGIVALAAVISLKRLNNRDSLSREK